jgi:hypothetical protein
MEEEKRIYVITMNQIHEDLICYIMDYLSSSCAYKLSMCSKYLYECTKRRGFAKMITYDYPLCDYNIFMKRYIRHHGAVQTFVVRNTNNPFYWLPKWTRRIHFEYCKIKDAINPKYAAVETEEITILSVIYDWEIKINWDKFPNLKKLVVVGYSVDLQGIERCKSLREIRYEPITKKP